MNGGDGKESYANHSLYQKTVISMVKPTLEETIEELYRSLEPECLKIADLGCSIGSNTLLVVSEVIHKIHITCQNLNKGTPPTFQVFLNDLPGNDFNALFRSLPEFYNKLKEEEDQIGNKKVFWECFIAGVPGSFYGRLFPNSSLHFFHSSYSLMWLSKVPKGLVSEDRQALNKGNIYVAETSPPGVHKAYFQQFHSDLTMFLKCRAEELVPGGSMILTTMGSTNSLHPQSIWEFVGLKLQDMVLEGVIEEEKLEEFNLPFYAATIEEVKELIEAQGCFTLQKLELFKMEWETYVEKTNSGLFVFDKENIASMMTTGTRAVLGPILTSQFGETILDNLFCRFQQGVLDYLLANNYCERIVNLVVSITKNKD